MKKILLAFLVVLCCSTIVTAQNPEQRIKEPGKVIFHPHWFIQAQVGAAHTVGEAKFTDLIFSCSCIQCRL